MSDSQKPDRDMYGWTRFKGTRNEWAWYWLDFHYAFHAKEQDDVETEVFCQELKKTKDAYDDLAERYELACQSDNAHREHYDALKQQALAMREALATIKKGCPTTTPQCTCLSDNAHFALEKFDEFMSGVK